MPRVRQGNDVAGIKSDKVLKLFTEARDCTSAGAYTASVMVCRKILMNLAVEFGAGKEKNFAEYVSYLADNGYVPPNGKGWVDSIRHRGNEANHEIAVMSENDAKIVLHFTEGLLRFIYEFPSILEKDNTKNGGSLEPQ